MIKKNHKKDKIKLLVTGASGFIGKNFINRAKSKHNYIIAEFLRKDNIKKLKELVIDADFILHFAGENRPKNKTDFEISNVNLTKKICEILIALNKKTPILFTSSTQIEHKNYYGDSKLRAEKQLAKLNEQCDNTILIYRLPGVFGKWCKPNYNSVVATFCYNIVNNLPIIIHDSKKILKLVYIDDVIDSFLKSLKVDDGRVHFIQSKKVYEKSLKYISEKLYFFYNSKLSLEIENVGIGFNRALYSTYISYFRPKNFSYQLKSYQDDRGVFVEMLKTKKSGQISYFTALPGVTRGGHYHETKTEKFLVIAGEAKFEFKHVITKENFKLIVSGKTPQVVETIPGWAHDITNIGDATLIVMLWANEVFDEKNPDTYGYDIYK